MILEFAIALFLKTTSFCAEFATTRRTLHLLATTNEGQERFLKSSGHRLFIPCDCHWCMLKTT